VVLDDDTASAVKVCVHIHVTCNNQVSCRYGAAAAAAVFILVVDTDRVFTLSHVCVIFYSILLAFLAQHPPKAAQNEFLYTSFLNNEYH